MLEWCNDKAKVADLQYIINARRNMMFGKSLDPTSRPGGPAGPRGPWMQAEPFSGLPGSDSPPWCEMPSFCKMKIKIKYCICFTVLTIDISESAEWHLYNFYGVDKVHVWNSSCSWHNKSPPTAKDLLSHFFPQNVFHRLSVFNCVIQGSKDSKCGAVWIAPKDISTDRYSTIESHMTLTHMSVAAPKWRGWRKQWGWRRTQ